MKPTILALLPLVTFSLTGCAGQASLQQRYVGTMTGCGAARDATLTRIRDDFAFAPGDGSLLVRGRIEPGGQLAGQVNTQPPGKPPYVLSVSGTIDAQAAALRYVTPRCTAEGRLQRVPARLLP